MNPAVKMPLLRSIYYFSLMKRRKWMNNVSVFGRGRRKRGAFKFRLNFLNFFRDIGHTQTLTATTMMQNFTQTRREFYKRVLSNSQDEVLMVLLAVCKSRPSTMGLLCDELSSELTDVVTSVG